MTFCPTATTREAQIPVYMIFGNHDYYDPQRYWFAFPENVILFSSEEVQTVQGTTKTVKPMQSVDLATNILGSLKIK